MKRTKDLIGKRVYWTDPDHGLSSGYGTVYHINGEIIHLSMEDGGETEAYLRELSLEEDPP